MTKKFNYFALAFAAVALTALSCSKDKGTEGQEGETVSESEQAVMKAAAGRITTDAASLRTLTLAASEGKYAAGVEDGEVVLEDGSRIAVDCSALEQAPQKGIPVVGVLSNAGKWYWSINGAVLKSGNTNLLVEDAAVVVGSEGGEWFAGAEGEDNPRRVSPSARPVASPVFLSVEDGIENVSVSLSCGVTLSLPKNVPLNLSLDTPEVTKLVPGETVSLTYSIESPYEQNSVSASFEGAGWKATVLEDEGLVSIVPGTAAAATLSVTVDNGHGKTVTRTADFTLGHLTIGGESSYIYGAFALDFVITIDADVPFSAQCEEDWVSVSIEDGGVRVKADANTEGTARRAPIDILTASGWTACSVSVMQRSEAGSYGNGEDLTPGEGVL